VARFTKMPWSFVIPGRHFRRFFFKSKSLKQTRAASGNSDQPESSHGKDPETHYQS
jgi:hypothetical protein